MNESKPVNLLHCLLKFMYVFEIVLPLWPFIFFFYCDELLSEIRVRLFFSFLSFTSDSVPCLLVRRKKNVETWNSTRTKKCFSNSPDWNVELLNEENKKKLIRDKKSECNSWILNTPLEGKSICKQKRHDITSF